MAYDSENHDYEIPNLGEENWGDEVQRTLEAIDADVIIKDTSGNRPNDPPENSWFLDETNDVLERYDGSSWHIVGGLGSATKPLPSVTTDQIVNESESEPTHPWIKQDVDADRAPLTIDAGGVTFNGEFDPIWYIGYNIKNGNSRIDTSTHAFSQSMEGHFKNGSGDVNMEWNLDASDAAGNNERFMAWQFDVDQDHINWQFAADSIIFKDRNVGGAELFRTNASGVFSQDDIRWGFGGNHKYFFQYSTFDNSLELRTNQAGGGTDIVLKIFDGVDDVGFKGGIGVFGTDPPSSVPGSYSLSNVTTDRTFDANSTTTAELADVLGTLITDLQAYGLVG